MVRPVTKEIKRRDVGGNTINLGPLVMGVTGGIECLGRKESLLSLGISLLDKKAPERFVSSTYLVVSVNNRLSATVYVVDGARFDSLGWRLSNKGYSVVAKGRFDNGPALKAWENGKLLYDNQVPPRVARTKSISGVRKWFLSLKRLMGV